MSIDYVFSKTSFTLEDLLTPEERDVVSRLNTFEQGEMFNVHAWLRNNLSEVHVLPVGKTRSDDCDVILGNLDEESAVSLALAIRVFFRVLGVHEAEAESVAYVGVSELHPAKL